MEDIAGAAAQLVFEYEGWGCEHVSDMFRTYEECGETAPCDFDSFGEACALMQKYKDEGLDYFTAQKKLVEEDTLAILG